MNINSCAFCHHPTPSHLNYCGLKCHIAAALADGFKIFTPNNLPIKSITADGKLLEHEHGDHPDYKFPVSVQYIGTTASYDDSDYGFIDCDHETHALIYYDDHIALTMYEHCYATFRLKDGLIVGGSLWKKGDWRLTAESLVKIKQKI